MCSTVVTSSNGLCTILAAVFKCKGSMEELANWKEKHTSHKSATADLRLRDWKTWSKQGKPSEPQNAALSLVPRRATGPFLDTSPRDSSIFHRETSKASPSKHLRAARWQVSLSEKWGPETRTRKTPFLFFSYLLLFCSKKITKYTKDSKSYLHEILKLHFLIIQTAHIN